jgi:hypothetical protein
MKNISEIDKKRIALSKKRKALLEYYEKNVFKEMKTLNAMAKKSAMKLDPVFDDIFKLLCDKGILLQAMGNVSGSKGALTERTHLDKRTVDGSSLELILEIMEELKKGTFKFKPLRRIYMDKSGKSPITKEQEIEK